jgi:hypothetical protein
MENWDSEEASKVGDDGVGVLSKPVIVRRTT